MAINNEPTIARSDRFTRTISYLPFAVRASDFANSLVAEPDSHEALTYLHIPKKKGAVEKDIHDRKQLGSRKDKLK